VFKFLPLDLIVSPTDRILQYSKQHPAILWGIGIAVTAAIVLIVILIRKVHKKGR
jgi:hypothetical protein